MRPSDAQANAARRNYKEAAIATVAAGLRHVVSREQIKRITWVPIPPSKTADHPEYDERLSRALTMACAGSDADIRSLLRRTTSTDADHSTPDRLSPEALYALLEIDAASMASKPPRGTIVLFDDIITTGKSFKCCERRLREVIPPATRIIGLFVARRILPTFDDEFEPLTE